jgi:hypothetical protein
MHIFAMIQGGMKACDLFAAGDAILIFLLLSTLAFIKLFPNIRWCRMIEVIEIVMTKGEIHLCANQVVKILLDALECIAGCQRCPAQGGGRQTAARLS